MGLVKDLGTLFRNWNDLESNLENEVLFYDFFRREEGYDPSRPLILCKNHGLLALYRMEGLDPEPLGEEGIEMASNAVRRAMDAFNADGMESEFRGGAWEVQNIFQRRRGSAPELTIPSRDSAALRFLCENTSEYWARRVIYQDELFWAIHFIPRNREQERWRLRSASQAAFLRLVELRAQARFVRRVLKTFEENLLAFQTARPRMGFGLRMLDEGECLQVLYRLTNRVDAAPPPLDPRLPLVTQACASHRDSSERVYRVNDRPTKALTWKVPPRISVGYVFRRFQDELGFPFTITQTWRSLEFSKMSGRIELFQGFAGALAQKQRESAEYEAEARHFLGTVRMEAAAPFNWYFNLLVDGDSVTELEDRSAKVQSQMKMIFGADCQEEGPRHRVFADLGSIPGNGSYCQRFNLVTSLNVGDSAFLFRLGAGDRKPFMIFGDRKGGAFAYSLFTAQEPSWNKAVLGLPGSGKSLLMNMFLVGNAMFPSQGYVLDKGNSYGPIFELMAQEMPGEVAVMRIRGGQFRFNPCPLAWALNEKERQEREGVYLKPLPDGGFLPCPVAQAKLFFEAWLDALVGQGRALEPAQKNLLDRALKGGDGAGRGGFFRDFENQCRQYLLALEKDPGTRLPPPRPLTSLLTFLRAEAPQFVDSVELWTRSPRDQFFDSGQDSVSSAKYIYFELEGIEDDPLLARPFVAALMGVIWNRIINPSTLHERKIVIIDEAWSFLADPSFFAVVEMMFRTIRKFNGFVVLSTQTPNDIKNGEARKLLQTMTEIEVNGFADVWIKGDGIRGHRRVETPGWADLQDFTTACTRISDVIQRRINQERPVLNGRLPGGERVNIVIPPACEKASMTIRKFPQDTMTLERLLAYGSVNPAIVTMARSLVQARKSILVGGGTGAGKTSTLNALSRLIPIHERVVTMEDARELQIQNPNWVAVEPYREGVVPVGIGDLVRNCLRMTPDRIVVGEVRGDEAFFLIRGLSSGHGGGFGTIHCNDAVSALRQLQLLAQMAPVGGLTSLGVAEMVGEAIDLVVYQALDEEDGKRRITEVVEVLKPGAIVNPRGGIEYRFRRLVRWDPWGQDWTFPQRPSAQLLRSIQLLDLEWPKESMRAPEQGPEDEEGEGQA